MMTRKTIVGGMGWIFCIPLLGGCTWPVMTEGNGYHPVNMGKQDQVMYWDAPQPTHLSDTFGQSVRAINKAQTFNPEAPDNLDPIEGQDGQAAVKAITRYRKFFSKPPFASSKGAKKK
ncbi:MAG: hypothetical protein O7F12_08540 [Nitrospirae bacterium]|nr:hypothetical protein [Nitrospirota bacterium]